MVKKCLECEKEFYCKPYQMDLRKYCSQKCYHKHTIGNYVGKNNPSYNPVIHNIKCNCGCNELLSSYHERKSGFIAYHNKEVVSLARSANAKKAIASTKLKLFKKYGTYNPSQVAGAMKRREKTMMDRYGVINAGLLSPKHGTKIEKKIEELLKNNNIPFSKQAKIMGWSVDFLITNKKLAIECDGDYWHNIKSVIEKDIRKNKIFSDAGWNLLRLTESEINKNINGCLYKIQKCL